LEYDALLADCLARAQVLRTLADRISAEEFPNETPRKFARTIGRLAAAVAQQLSAERGEASFDPLAAGAQLKNTSDLLLAYGQFLQYASAAQTHAVPWSLIGPLERFARRIDGGTDLLVCPTWTFNYEISSEDIGEWLRASAQDVLPEDVLRDCVSALPEHVRIVMFPILEKNSALYHCALAHEIGHGVVHRVLEAGQAMPPHIRKRLDTMVAVESAPYPLFRENLTTEWLKKVGYYWRRAVEEIGSDIVGARVLGPPFLLALSRVASTMGLDIPPGRANGYPPFRLRLQLVLQEVTRLGLTDFARMEAKTPPEARGILAAYQGAISQLESVASSASFAAAAEEHPTLALAYDWLQESLPGIVDEIAKRCGTDLETLDAERLWGTGLLLAHTRLAKDLPPNTLDDSVHPPEPASFESILLAAWLHHLSAPSLRLDATRPNSFLDHRRLHERLALRAIELAEMQRVYKCWRDGVAEGGAR
jgi:hypothetical protein